MTHKPRKRSFNANTRLTSENLPHLVTKVLQLGTGPKADYLKEQLLSKYVSKDTSPAVVRRNRAIAKWLATEERNASTNDRLLTISGEYNILPRVTYDAFIATCQRFAADILGDVPPWEAFHGAFSGGATTSRKRTESHPAGKYLGQADVTPGALYYFADMFGECETWVSYRTDDELRLVRGNELFTVPKTTEIDRCACKEPDFNMYMQKGIGGEIRRCLRRVGINLNDQSRNQALAREGSITGDLATIDLSSASDSIATELVFQIVPTIWYEALSALRSPETNIDGEWHVNHMFSSMGNGFTFELESLLFYVIARAVAYHTGTPGVISVYGDDLIVPSEIAPLLSFVLSVLGFEVNASKSFWEGPFRESCGGHYHDGLDITPFYLKAPIERLVDLIHFLNQLRKWCRVDEALPILDPSGYEVWKEYAQLVPQDLWGGHDYGDKYRLVSYDVVDRPKRLNPIKRTMSTGLGGYLHWLDCRQSAETPGESLSSERSIETERYRLRPVKAVSERPFPFPQEVGA